MQPGDFDGDWEAASKELLMGMKAWRVVHAHATLSEIEAELDRRMRELRGEMLEDLAQASALADIAALPEAERPICPQCGARMGPRGQERRTLQTAGDQEVSLERSYVVCPHCDVGFFPPG